MLTELVVKFKHFLQLGHLPKWLNDINWEHCTRSRPLVAADMLYIYFVLNTVPTHYGSCRLWEVPRAKWPQYFGSSYNHLAYSRLSKEVQPAKFEVLYRDKQIGALLCQGLNVPQPTLLGILDPSRPYREDIKNFLARSDSRRIMIKPALGRGGSGVVLIEERQEGVIARRLSGEMPLDDFALEERAIVQEFVVQHERMAQVSSASVNTCRLVTGLSRTGEIIIIKSIARFSSGDSFVDNWSTGGISIAVDSGTGRLAKIGRNNTSTSHERHPVSGVIFGDFTIPEWQRVRELALSIHRELPYFKIIGVDICINKNGQPLLIEMNPYPDLLEQNSGPLLAKPEVLQFFNEYGLLSCKKQRALLNTNVHSSV